MKSVAIILARAGSKGIPRKNMSILNDRFIIEYTIDACLNSNIDEVYVSTDGNDIAAFSISQGATTIKRPAEFATDEATSESALLHAVSQVESDIVVFVQPTSPMLLSKDINKCLNAVTNEGYDSAFTGYKQHWAGAWYQKVDAAMPLYSTRPRRQEVEPLMIENGACYVTRTSCLLGSKNRLSGKTKFIEMPAHRSFQVDTPEDLILIENIMRAQ